MNLFVFSLVDAIRRVSQIATGRIGHVDPENVQGLGGQMALPQTERGPNQDCNSLASLQGNTQSRAIISFLIIRSLSTKA